MAVHAVLVRIDYDDDYSKRYDETVAAIRKQADGTIWDEPTSTSILKSAKSAQKLCDDIYYGSPLLESKDMLVVINLSMKEYAQRGVSYPATLASLMTAR